MEFQLPTGGMDEFAEWPAQVSGHFPFGFEGNARIQHQLLAGIR